MLMDNHTKNNYNHALVFSAKPYCVQIHKLALPTILEMGGRSPEWRLDFQ